MTLGNIYINTTGAIIRYLYFRRWKVLVESCLVRDFASIDASQKNNRKRPSGRATKRPFVFESSSLYQQQIRYNQKIIVFLVVGKMPYT